MKEKLCKCGCGGVIVVKPHHKRYGIPDYIHGHNKPGKTKAGLKRLSDSMKGTKHSLGKQNALGYRHTDEAIEKIRVSSTGRKHTEESIEKIRDVLVNHHYIYDESDLTKYTTKMTRSKHAQIHAAMRKEGIVVPHINIKD